MRTSLISLALLAAALRLAAAEEAEKPDAGENPAEAEAAKIDKPGVYRQAGWEYVYRQANAGSKSEGWHGDLFYEGIRVPAAENINDYHHTPWGPLYWTGRPPVLFGSHGWMPRHLASKPVGKALPLPQLDDGGPLVSVIQLREDDNVSDDPDKYRTWAEEKAKLLASDKPPHVIFSRRLSYRETCIHDSRHCGRLAARLLYPRDRENISILLDGTIEPMKVTMPRRDSAIGFACPTLHGFQGMETRFALFFRIERASPESPLPAYVGEDADGKSIEIRNASRIVIALPAHESRHIIWQLHNLEGDALRAAGDATILPDFRDIRKPGTAEISFLAVHKGTATVTLHLKAEGYDDKSPVRVFKATFIIPEEPPPLPGEQGQHLFLP